MESFDLVGDGPNKWERKFLARMKGIHGMKANPVFLALSSLIPFILAKNVSRHFILAKDTSRPLVASDCELTRPKLSRDTRKVSWS